MSIARNAKEVFAGDSRVEVVSAQPGWVCLRIEPVMELRARVVAFFRSQFSDLPSELCEKLTLALDELLGNAIEHGCNLSPKCAVGFTCIRTKRVILFEITDAGPGFSLNDIPHAALNNPPEDPLQHTKFRLEKGMRPGGFGIMMVKQIADELVYNEQGNGVVMVKYLR